VPRNRSKSRPTLPLRETSRSFASFFLAAPRRALFFALLILSAPINVAAQAGHNEAHMVLVNVTVLDHTDRPVPGLQAEQFAVLNGQSPHAVTYFSNADEPTSLIVVLDVTAGMAARIDEERKALAEFIRGANPQDELALIVIRDEPQVVVHLGGSANEIERIAATIQADGFGSMWDGTYLGIAELQSSRCRRKAMIVISDDGENYSRHTPSALMSVLKQSDVQVYAIGRFDRYANRFQVRMRALQLDQVTSVTGGRVLSGNDLSRAAAQIAYELRHQYVLGFYPSHSNRDGQWHEFKVRLSRSISASKLRLYAKRGYYAPAAG